MSAASTELTGYAGRLSVAPGDSVSFHVSSSEPEVGLRIVRLVHGDTNPEGPGHKEVAVRADVEGRYRGRLQRAHAGSFGLVQGSGALLDSGALTIAAIIFPTTPSVGRDQGIVSWWSESAQAGVSLYIDERGAVGFRAGGVSVAADALPLGRRRWYLVAGGFDNESRSVKVFVRPIGRLVSVEPVAVVGELSSGADGCVRSFAARGPGAAGPATASEGVFGHFNGKIEAPRLFSRLLSDSELNGLLGGAVADPALLAYWDGSVSLSGSCLQETVAGRHARLVNRPTRAVTGWSWSGREVNPAYARPSTGRFTSTTTTSTMPAGSPMPSGPSPRTRSAVCMPPGWMWPDRPIICRSSCGPSGGGRRPRSACCGRP